MKTRYCLIFLTLAYITQVFTQPTTILFGGNGVDGMWYSNIITSPDTPIDDYHLFKSLPAFCVKYSLQLFGKDNTMHNLIFAWKIMNAMCCLISLFVAYKITSLMNYSDGKSSFYLFIVFTTFLLLKIGFYDVVTPDIFAFMVSFLLLYSILAKKILLSTSLFLIASFTNPIISIIYFILLFFRKVTNNKENFFSKDNTFFVKFVPIIFGLFIFAWGVAVIVYLKLTGAPMTLWIIPDDLDLEIFPISILAVSLFSFFLFKPIWEQISPYLSLNLYRELNYKWILFCILLFASKKAIIINNNFPISLDDIDHLLRIWPLFFCMKPLAGLSEHLQSFGLLLFLILIFWKTLVKEASKSFGFGGISVLCLFILFIIKPEARHTLPFIPFISFLMINSIQTLNLNKKKVLFLIMVNIILSKFYYPLSFAKFNDEYFQSFPSQHYLMFYGFSINYSMYLVFILLNLFSFLVIYLLTKDMKIYKQ